MLLLVYLFNEEVPVMTWMIPDTPMDWDTMAELPQQVKSIKAKQGQRTHILPYSET